MTVVDKSTAKLENFKEEPDGVINALILKDKFF